MGGILYQQFRSGEGILFTPPYPPKLMYTINTSRQIFHYYLKSCLDIDRDSGLSLDDKNRFVFRFARMHRSGKDLESVIRIRLQNKQTF